VIKKPERLKNDGLLEVETQDLDAESAPGDLAVAESILARLLVAHWKKHQQERPEACEKALDLPGETSPHVPRRVVELKCASIKDRA